MSTWPALIKEIICALLVMLFIYAAGSKLLDHTRFLAQLEGVPVLTPFAGLLMWLVPAAEILTAMALTVRRLRLAGLCMSFGLMFLFTSYIALALLKTFGDIPCSCGGVLNNLSWKEHLAFNVLFTLLALTGIILEKRTRTTFQDRTGKKSET